jgi:hypothetical protein
MRAQPIGCALFALTLLIKSNILTVNKLFRPLVNNFGLSTI